MRVDVVLNAQQMQLVERLCAELGLESPARALAHGMVAWARAEEDHR